MCSETLTNVPLNQFEIVSSFVIVLKIEELYMFGLSFCIIRVSAMNTYINDVIILAHLSQRLIGELIVYPCSSVRRPCCQPFSNIFSSETTWRFKAKFYVEPPSEGGT